VGSSHDLSSSVPALSMQSSGADSISDTIGEPQLLQNWRRTLLPLSPWSRYSLRVFSSSILNEFLVTPTIIEKAVPLWRWQFSQWQTPVIIGSLSKEYLTAPHKQPPQCLAIFIEPSNAFAFQDIKKKQTK
jgi:hypothetical protein